MVSIEKELDEAGVVWFELVGFVTALLVQDEVEEDFAEQDEVEALFELDEVEEDFAELEEDFAELDEVEA